MLQNALRRIYSNSQVEACVKDVKPQTVAASKKEDGPSSYTLDGHLDDRRYSCIASSCRPDSVAGDGGGVGGRGVGSDCGGSSDCVDGLRTASRH